MRLSVQTRIDFMKYRNQMMLASLAFIVLGLLVILTVGMNYGLDFAGGTLVRVAFVQPRPDEEIRRALEAHPEIGAPLIQSIRGEYQETLIRLPSRGEEQEAKLLEAGESDQSVATAVIQALSSETDAASRKSGKLDLNTNGRDVIAARLLELDPEGLAPATDDARKAALAKYREVGDAIKVLQRDSHGILRSLDELADKAGIGEKTLAALREHTFVSDLAITEVGYVGPQVGNDLREKALLATFFSFLGILAYIWARFELTFGLAAVVATLHDVFVTMAIIAILRIEFDLTIVAAILTIIGYSVNDTIVIFDRVRENLRIHRRADFVDLCNYSVNQTMSRTILTGSTTMFTLICLAILGAGVTRGFAITLLLGIVIGTYSSIYIASPVAILTREMLARRAAARATA